MQEAEEPADRKCDWQYAEVETVNVTGRERQFQGEGGYCVTL